MAMAWLLVTGANVKSTGVGQPCGYGPQALTTKQPCLIGRAAESAIQAGRQKDISLVPGFSPVAQTKKG